VVEFGLGFEVAREPSQTTTTPTRKKKKMTTRKKKQKRNPTHLQTRRNVESPFGRPL
jgi:hypothetical protein